MGKSRGKVGVWVAIALVVPAFYVVMRYLRDLGNSLGSLVDIFKESWE